MSVKSVPNKYEIFQMFYYDRNNKWLSITDAMQYYYELDSETKLKFEQYYKDETGYEIISPNGFGLDKHADSRLCDKNYKDKNGNPTAKILRKKKVKKKKVNIKTEGNKKIKEPVMKDGKVVWGVEDAPVYASSLSSAKKTNIQVKATMDAIAKKRGIILDPVWSAYTAEEIMAMFNDGVNIPQDIVDLASTELQENPTITSDEEENPDGVEDETTEKEPFLNLIPKAEDKIEKCEENNNKLEKEITDLIPEEQKQEKDINSILKKQRETLDEYQNSVKEYTKLQKKIENGDSLTEKEQKRYEDLSKILGTQKNEADGFELDKTEITKSLNDINILAVLGEKLADETVEVGEDLTDYTSKTNYKATRASLGPKMWIGDFYMQLGKALGKEAINIGNDTKEYTTQTQTSVDGIAETLDIKDGLASKEAVLSGEVQPSENSTDEKAEKENNQDKQQKMPSVVTDSFVVDLIKEGKDINSDLAKQIKIANRQIKFAKGDILFANMADKRITQIVKAFYDAEEKRQKDIEKTEKENEKKEQEIQDVMAEAQKRAEEEAREKAKKENLDSNNVDINAFLNGQNDTKNNVQVEYTDEEMKKINSLNDEISDNNQKISGIKQESVQHREQVKKSTSKEKTTIDKAMPVEKDAQKVNQAYQEEDLPEHNERMDFINKAGMILAGIGTTEITVGSRMIVVGHALMSNPWTLQQGIAMVVSGSMILTKGTISLGIGLTAMKVSDDESLIEKAEKKTDVAGTNINRSITDLSTVDKKIVDVTKAMSADDGEDNENTPAVATEGSNNENDDKEKTQNPQAEDATTPAQAASTQNVTTSTSETPEEVVENATTQNPAQEVKPNEQPQGTEEGETPAGENTVDTNTTSNNSSKTEKEQDPQKAAKDAEKNAAKQKSQLKKQTDKQNGEVKDASRTAKNYTKESTKLVKDEKKSQKQLEKEAKVIEKEIKKEEEETIKLTKESQEHAKKQAEMFAEYQTLSAQNETLAAEDAGNKQTNNQQAQAPGSTGFALQTQTGAQGGNSEKITQNNARIAFLSTEFQVSSNVIKRNKVKITNFQSSITTRTKKFQKKTKLVTKKAKAAEKKEKQKQKKLRVQLGAVGIAENVFSATAATGLVLTTVGASLTTTGTAMIAVGNAILATMNPFTAAIGTALVASGTAINTSGTSCTGVGNVLNTIGLYGTLACGVAKATINIANGNLAAGLMALGQTAVSAALSMTGASAAGNAALTYVSQGLTVVSSSADMVNNVKAVQGKESNGLASKISTIAGVGASATNVAGSFGNFAQSGSLSQIAKIGTAVGTTLSSTSQMMNEFGGESKAANILGMVGGAINTVSAVASTVGAKKDQENPEIQKKRKAKEDAKMAKAMGKVTKQADQISIEKTGMTIEQADTLNKFQARMNELQPSMQAEMDAQVAKIRADFNSKTPAMGQEDPALSNIAEQENTLANLPTNSNEFDVSKMKRLEGLDIPEAGSPVNIEIKGVGLPVAPLNLDNTDNTNKPSLLENISQGIGAATNVAGAFLQNGQNGSQQQNKKAPAAFNDKRTEEIMKKNRKKRENVKKMLDSQRKIAALKKLRAAV